jgi:HK97 family phage major capsid protein
MTPKELREQRAKLIADARDEMEQAEKDGREWTEEDEARFDKRMADADKLRKKYEREERLQAAEKDVAASRGVSDADELDDNFAGGDGSVNEQRNGTADSPELRAAFGAFLGAEAAHAPTAYAEYRALQTDVDAQAGYLVPPEQFVNELIADLDDEVFIRGWSRTFTVRQARSLGAPKRTTRMSTFAWSAEIVAPTADTALAFAKRELYPHYLTGEILVSRDLMRSAVMSPEAIVRGEMARDAGEVQEDGFLSGNGSQQPLGLFTASADGISTGRDISTGNTTTEVKFDGLLEAKWSLKMGYWNRSRWLFNRTIAKQIAKEKNGIGEYLWRESVRVGEPDTLLGRPAFISERAPNTATTGLYVGMLGDFSNYWIADALDMEMQRLDELHARTNQVGFIGRIKTDGMPVTEEAFSRVTLA